MIIEKTSPIQECETLWTVFLFSSYGLLHKTSVWTKDSKIKQSDSFQVTKGGNLGSSEISFSCFVEMQLTCNEPHMFKRIA